MRLYLLVEGQTEERFVKDVLQPHLVGHCGWHVAEPILVQTKKGFRGGVVNYDHVRRDLGRLLGQHGGKEVRITTMLDLYALPANFPGRDTAPPDPYQRVAHLETELAKDVADWRFVPYIQLHEFEALALAGLQQLPALLSASLYDAHALADLHAAIAAVHGNPELVDEGSATAPSKRLAAVATSYKGRKPILGPALAQAVGLPGLIARCPHFGEWVTQLCSVRATA